MKNETSSWFRELQNSICMSLGEMDSECQAAGDKWHRPGGGGGVTQVFRNGKIIEKGGVNFSEVYGIAPDFLKSEEGEEKDRQSQFFATGVSIVLHPVNPEMPIIHMNVRYLEIGAASWFGGGIDLTPHYIIEDDAAFFHGKLKASCDLHHHSYYPTFKKEADDYFFIPHRNETRGIGGIFFDRLKSAESFTIKQRFDFVKSIGETFFPVYTELVNRNAYKKYTSEEIKWQRLRRGRYAEFNLVYDRGTKFGLDTNGRTESILMSLPPMAQWEYDYKPLAGSREEKTQNLLKKNIDWIKLT